MSADTQPLSSNFGTVEQLKEQFAEVEGLPLRRPVLEQEVIPAQLSQKDAISYVIDTIALNNVQHVAFEGPPIYAYPHPERPAQHWDSPTFSNGWMLSEDLRNAIKRTHKKVGFHHWLMVDNVNVRGVDASTIQVNSTLDAIQKSWQRNLNILSRPEHAYLEGDFLSDPKHSRCSDLDADFQLQKLEDTLALQTNEALPLIVSVHPLEFQQQQVMMFERLLGGMKQSEYFRSMPRAKRREFIENVYRHIWTDSDGNVTRITHPAWNGITFEFADVDVKAVAQQADAKREAELNAFQRFFRRANL